MISFVRGFESHVFQHPFNCLNVPAVSYLAGSKVVNKKTNPVIIRSNLLIYFSNEAISRQTGLYAQTMETGTV
jgi:hypothetical protein